MIIQLLMYMAIYKVVILNYMYSLQQHGEIKHEPNWLFLCMFKTNIYVNIYLSIYLSISLYIYSLYIYIFFIYIYIYILYIYIFIYFLYALFKLGYKTLKALGCITWVYIHKKITKM